MFHFISCMVLILATTTNALAAQASELNISTRLETKNWVTSYAGETEVDGLQVTVNLDEAKSNLVIPEIMIGASSLVPFNETTVKRSFRLNFMVSHNPRIQTAYVIEPRTVSISGDLRLAYVSNLDQRNFQFVATIENDNTVLVSYTRKTSLDTILTGQIVLSAVPRILAK